MAQPVAEERGVLIGERVPALTISGLLNSGSGSVALHSLYGKGLLLIDFWATWCVPCINGLPRLDSLKNHFNGQMDVLAVTYEDKELIKKFMQANPVISGLLLRLIWHHRWACIVMN